MLWQPLCRTARCVRPFRVLRLRETSLRDTAPVSNTFKVSLARQRHDTILPAPAGTRCWDALEAAASFLPLD